MKKRMTVMLSLCLSLLLLLSACASGGSTAKNAEKAAAALAESMLNVPSEPMQRFGSILESGEESALTAYKDAWEDEKALCSENGFTSFIEEVLTMQLMADEMNETVKVDRRQDRALRRKGPRGALYGRRHRERYGKHDG